MLRRALARDRAERHPNAAALAADLALAVRSYEGETAFPPDPPVLGATLVGSVLPAIAEVSSAARAPAPAPAPAPAVAATASEPDLELVHSDLVPTAQPEWELPSPQRGPTQASTTSSGPGLGLALAIVAALLVAASGIWIVSGRWAPARGTRTPPATTLADDAVPATVAPVDDGSGCRPRRPDAGGHRSDSRSVGRADRPSLPGREARRPRGRAGASRARRSALRSRPPAAALAEAAPC